MYRFNTRVGMDSFNEHQRIINMKLISRHLIKNKFENVKFMGVFAY